MINQWIAWGDKHQFWFHAVNVSIGVVAGSATAIGLYFIP